MGSLAGTKYLVFPSNFISVACCRFYVTGIFTVHFNVIAKHKGCTNNDTQSNLSHDL